MSNEHIPPEAMAELADGTSRADRDVLLAHLASCHRCAAVYAELVGHRADWLGRRDELAAPTELVDRGLSVPASVSARESAMPSPSRTARRCMTFRVVASAAVLAVVVVTGLWWTQQGRPAHPAFVDEIAGAVEARMMKEPLAVAYTARAHVEGDTTRSGSQNTSQPAPSLARLAEYYNRESMTADVACWLIGGYLTTGQMRNAEVYLGEALDRFPRDARICRLAGILAYKRNDLDGAERHFRAAIDLDPRDGVAYFNLGVVLTEQERSDDAAPVLERAGVLLRGTPLADRVPEVMGPRARR